MKLSRLLLPLMACALIFASCEPNNDPENSGQQETIILRNTSVQEGAVVSASLDVITLEYNKVVTAAADANITLNGKKVSATKNPGTAMKVDISVSLEAETDYTLSVPSGAIVMKDDATQTAKAFTLKFTTKRGASSGDEISANNMVAALGFGWNLGNHFDSYDEGNAAANYRITWNPSCPYWDGAIPTAKLYENLAANGVKTVRMCVTWGPYQNMTDGNYTIEDAYINEVAQNVQWALENGIYVLLNTHHDEYWQNIVAASTSGETDTQIRDRITKTWTNIATYFRDYDQHLLFETFNELHDNAWGWGAINYRPIYNLMDQWNQVAVDAIRATGGNNATRWIGVPGFCASPNFTCGSKNKIKLPTDPANHIMVAVHSYTPFNFCTEGTVQRWGHTFKGNDNDENEIKNMFAELKREFVDKGIPCYMGEFGCETRLDPADEPYRTYFMEYLCRTAYFAGIPVMLWDNDNSNQNANGGGGECFWYISHRDGTVHTPELLRTMIKAATSDFTSYTIESIYNNAPK